MFWTRYTGCMRDALVIFIAIILSIVIGGYLFMNGGTQFNTPPGVAIETTDSSVMILAEGQNSGSVDRRTNYRIMTDVELQELWTMVHGQSGPGVPNIDFSEYEVIAIFDGTHSSGGYDVDITDITDANGVRAVHILRQSPGDNCAVTEAITSPFQIVRVSKSPLPISKEEEVRVNECS